MTDIERPETTAEVGALLRGVLGLPLNEGIAFAYERTDRESFLPPMILTRHEREWWLLVEGVFERYREAAEHPGERNAIALERALVARHIASDVTDLDDMIDVAKGKLCPRWHSGIDLLDSAAGGAYGTEVIAGSPGAGKSMIALDQAIQAAAAGWRVLYFDTEMSVPNLRLRLDAVHLYRANDYFKAMVKERRIHFAGLDTLRGGFAGLCEFVTKRIMPSDEHVLIVLDHVHDVARGLVRSDRKSHQFFGALEAVADAAKTSRRETEGSVGWILVAEQNTRGGVRGGQLDYAADLWLSLTKEDEPGVTSIVVEKGREGGDGPYGRFFRDSKRGRLTPLEDYRPEPPQPEDPRWEM